MEKVPAIHSLWRKEKMRILKVLLKHTTALQQKWMVRIILKGKFRAHQFMQVMCFRILFNAELKIGMSEKSMLSYFHPYKSFMWSSVHKSAVRDAIELFNVTSNLRKVCTELNDPNKRIASHIVDVTRWFNASNLTFSELNCSILLNPCLPPGKLMPSLFWLQWRYSSRPRPPLTLASKKDPFVIETKFDGERIQVHKQDNKIRLFSRCAALDTSGLTVLETATKWRTYMEKK